MVLRKVICSIFVLLLCLSIPINIYAEEKQEYKLSIETTQIDYHHLGKSISITHVYNTTKVKNGDLISSSKNKIIIKTTIIENDNCPDIGEGLVEFSNDGKAHKSTILITVNETGGKRYPNAYATWEVTYSIKPVKKQFSFFDHSNSLDDFIFIALILIIAKLVFRNNSSNKKTNQITKSNTSSSVNTKNDLNKKDASNPCPMCGSPMRIVHGKYGNFYGCTKYPRCKGTKNIEKIKDKKICPKCGGVMLKKYTSDGIMFYCRKTKACGYAVKAELNYNENSEQAKRDYL